MVPRVTVILATYNWSAVLPFSIGSVLRQTFADFELLVVGDGCTDDSQQVVESIGDPRVRWIGLPVNSGHQSVPNNEGLRQARGEIVAYIGHDDLWLPNHLEAHVAAHDREAADVVYSLCLNVPPSNATPWPQVPRPARGWFSPPSAMTHRRATSEELGGWKNYEAIDAKRDGSPDVELWRRFAAAGRPFAFARRLTAIKLPASWRRDVYRTKPSAEQAQWLARIDAEPDLEQTLLVDCAVSEDVPRAILYRDLVRSFLKETFARFRRRAALPSIAVRRTDGATRDEVRRFKGL